MEENNQNTLPTEAEAVNQSCCGHCSKKSCWKWVFLVVLLFLAASLIYAGYQFSKLSQKQTPLPLPTPMVQSSPTPTPDETTNWQKYVFKDFSLSFKYPNFVQLKEIIPQEEKPPISRSGGFKVEIEKGDSLMTIDPDGIEGLGFETNDYEVSQQKLIVNNHDVIIGGKNISKIRILYKPTNSIWYFIPIKYPGNDEKSVAVNYKNKLADIDKETQALFDQILSTFKFLE